MKVALKVTASTKVYDWQKAEMMRLARARRITNSDWLREAIENQIEQDRTLVLREAAERAASQPAKEGEHGE